jgi:hypothetical protein
MRNAKKLLDVIIGNRAFGGKFQYPHKTFLCAPSDKFPPLPAQRLKRAHSGPHGG